MNYNKNSYYMNRNNVLKEGKMDYKEMEYELKRKKYIELTNILKYILKDKCNDVGIEYSSLLDNNQYYSEKKVTDNDRMINDKDVIKEDTMKNTEKLDYVFEDTYGMKEAKKKLKLYIDACEFKEKRNEEGYIDDFSNSDNFIIIGDRGSGKTHLANNICKIWECNKSDVLCIDAILIEEAKDIYRNINNEKIIIFENIEDIFMSNDIMAINKLRIAEAIKKFMGDVDEGYKVIITGNEEAVNKLKIMEPLIEKLAFDIIKIEKYSTEELWGIAGKLAEKDRYKIASKCKERITKWIELEQRQNNFTNCIAIGNFIKEAEKNHAGRFIDTIKNNTLSYDEKQIRLCRLEPEDFPQNENDKIADSLCKELENMVGLERVKKEVRAQIANVTVTAKARKAGYNNQRIHGTLHMAFVGEPGTGKTTVARLVGKIYCALGILPKDEVHVVSRADLVSVYVGGTAQNVKDICERADGGVLFIDEAYSLVNSDQDSYGKEAVDTLIQEMENRRDSMMIILAGYEEPMKKFFKSNPGFQSRVPNIIHFDNYKQNELIDIFEYMLKDEGYYLTSEAYSQIDTLIKSKSQQANFANARGVRNLLDEIINAQKLRLQQYDDSAQVDYVSITLDDIKYVQNKINTEEKTIDELLDELNALEGLTNVKKKVNEMINSQKYIELMKKRGLDPGRSQGTMHLVFSGNPGTGKSTVASLLGQIYVKLGVLKKNTFVLVKRSDLIGRYQGHTAAKVANKVAEADGGILFIDEAYQLYNGERDSFGEEAIGTLLSLVEEKRDSLMVILAGYTENMEDFFEVNPGLKSRFPNTIEFTDYTLSELLTIFVNMVQKDGKLLQPGVIDLVKEKINKRQQKDAKEFANARGVRNILDEIILRQRSRIMEEVALGKEHTQEELITINKGDI